MPVYRSHHYQSHTVMTSETNNVKIPQLLNPPLPPTHTHKKKKEIHNHDLGGER